MCLFCTKWHSNFLILDLERHQQEVIQVCSRKIKKADNQLIIVACLNDLPFELFSLGQLQWLLITMKVVKLQHSTKKFSVML